MSHCMISTNDGEVDFNRLQKLIEALVEIAPIKAAQETE